MQMIVTGDDNYNKEYEKLFITMRFDRLEFHISSFTNNPSIPAVSRYTMYTCVLQDSAK